jgi:hypothetical protein
MGRWTNDTTGARVSVADEKDHRFASGWHATGSTPKPAKSDTPDKTWKNDELKAYADENGVDLGDATKKEDLLAAIELHNEALDQSGE